MDKNKFPRIEPEKCDGCGLCVPVCPDHSIEVTAGKAQINGDRCMDCGHCAAACPQKALWLPEEREADFETITPGKQWLRPGENDGAELIRFLASRRSCRNFKKRAVAAELLRDLVRGAVTAPSGTNSRKWSFHIIPERKGVKRFGDMVAAFYQRLNRMAANPLLRFTDRIFGQGRLESYHRRHQTTVTEGLNAWVKEGRDLLFHGAPAVILVASLPGASCPAEDAILASGNLMLTAHALGLATCMIGFTVAAMARDRSIGTRLGIAGEEKIHAAIAVGYGRETYARTCDRRWPAVRFVNE